MGIREARIARETVNFVKAQINVGNAMGRALLAAKKGTEHFKDEDSIVLSPRGAEDIHSTVIEVTSERCLTASERSTQKFLFLSTVVYFRLHRESFVEPCVLNFADAFIPGGLFFEGATTQEEAICRSSGLYQCLEGHELYTRNSEHKPTGVAIHDMLYSPGVPVFRDHITEEFIDEEQWYNISVITSAAPNAFFERMYYSKAEIEAKFQERIRRLLTVLSNKKKEAVVFGAWGCGAFGNDPEMVAKAFNDALTETFKGHFKRVVFAIYDRSSVQNINSFRKFIATS